MVRALHKLYVSYAYVCSGKNERFCRTCQPKCWHCLSTRESVEAVVVAMGCIADGSVGIVVMQGFGRVLRRSFMGDFIEVGMIYLG